MQNFSSKTKKIPALLGASCLSLLLLTACSSTQQTPLEQQESYIKPQFQATFTEDRITLRFKKNQEGLTADQQAYVERFTRFYQKTKDSVFFVSMIKEPSEVKGSKLPFHNPSLMNNFDAVVGAVAKQGKRPHIITEVDTEKPEVVAPEKNTGNVVVKPVASKLDEDRKIAVIIRQYTLKPANCPQLAGWDWNKAEKIGHRSTIGCAVSTNLLAQIKDKSRLVYGETLDQEYYSGYDLTVLKTVAEGTWKPEFEKELSSGGGDK